MPLTFAHPAAVLSIRRITRGRLSFAAMVLGSMTPDVGYFFGRFDVATLAHTLYGLIAVCLPTGLVLQFLLRSFRYPASYLLPQPHRGALATLPLVPLYGSPTTLLFVAISLVLGAFTHVIWDSFTHQTGWAVQQFPGLRQVVTIIPGLSTEFFHLLQHISTVLGLAALFVTYTKWLALADARSGANSTPTSDTWRYVLLAIICVGSLSIAVPLAYARSFSKTGEFLLHPFFFQLALLSTAWFAGLYLVSSLLVGRWKENV